jgi:hypothetical protein
MEKGWTKEDLKRVTTRLDLIDKNMKVEVCKEKVIVIKDYFFLDFTSNNELLYKDINSVEKVGNAVILHNKELELKEAEPKVYFENQKDTKEFQQSINDKLTNK